MGGVSSEEGLVAWLRGQVEADLALARRVAARHVAPPGHERAGEAFWPVPGVTARLQRFSDPDVRAGLDLIRAHGPQWAIADCEAKLALIGACEDQMDRDPRENDGYSEGRDDDEIKRDEALADFAGDVLSLLAQGYRHRDGYAEHWPDQA